MELFEWLAEISSSHIKSTFSISFIVDIIHLLIYVYYLRFLAIRRADLFKGKFYLVCKNLKSEWNAYKRYLHQ